MKGWVSQRPELWADGGRSHTPETAAAAASNSGLIFSPPYFDLKNVWRPRQPLAAVANRGSRPHALPAPLQRPLASRRLSCDGKQARVTAAGRRWG